MSAPDDAPHANQSITVGQDHIMLCVHLHEPAVNIAALADRYFVGTQQTEVNGVVRHHFDVDMDLGLVIEASGDAECVIRLPIVKSAEALQLFCDTNYKSGQDCTALFALVHFAQQYPSDVAPTPVDEHAVQLDD